MRWICDLFCDMLLDGKEITDPSNQNERRDCMERSVIESVMYTYVGDDGQFNRFLKSVIQEYVSDEMTAPMPAENETADQEKSA